ncbi:MAG: aminopeptidase, partial [Nanoarchaeota archaeon]
TEQLRLYPCTQHYTQFSADNGKGRTLNLLLVTQPFFLPDSLENFHLNFDSEKEYREPVQAMYFSSTADSLIDEKDFYLQEGYDVFSRSTTNFNDPTLENGSLITPSFLKQPQLEQAFTVIHEICHDNVAHTIGDFPSELNESYCVLVGRAGAADYYRSRNGENSSEYQKAIKALDKTVDRSEHINSYYFTLQELYKSDKPSADKMEQRDRIFAEAGRFMIGQVNNAALLDAYPYVKYLPLFSQLYESKDKELLLMLEGMKNCPGNEESAIEYIKILME